MLLSRRTLIAASATMAAVPAFAQAADPRMGLRALGNPAAPVKLEEWFSLSCTHCANWSQTVFPQVKTQLIDTGKIYYIYRDYPLDQLALTAAMVARALPPERYEAFVNVLFTSQDRWAFARGIDNDAEIYKRAALAGMPKALFDATIHDEGLRNAILTEQQRAVDTWHVDSTPTFILNGKPYPGEQPFDKLASLVAAAS